MASNLIETNTPIKILPKDIYDISGRKIFVSNKIDNVNYSYCQVNKVSRSEISNTVGPLTLFEINDDVSKELNEAAVWVGNNDGSDVILDWDGYPGSDSNTSNVSNMRCAFTLSLNKKIDAASPLYLKKTYREVTINGSSVSKYDTKKSEYKTIYYSALTSEQINEVRQKGTLTFTSSDPFYQNVMINTTPSSIVGYTIEIKTDFTVSLVAENYNPEEVIVNDINKVNSFDYPYNELMTSQSLISDNANEIINYWRNGKRTIHLKIKYGKYSDIDGKVVYNGSDGTYISVNDIVRPFKKDNVPLFVKSDGSPIDFRVLTSEIVYEGTLYLEIDLIEN